MYNSSINFKIHFTCGMECYYVFQQQPLHNHHARLLQLCKVANSLHKLPQSCDNIVTTLQGCSKSCHNLVISIWEIAIDTIIIDPHIIHIFPTRRYI